MPRQPHGFSYLTQVGHGRDDCRVTAGHSVPQEGNKREPRLTQHDDAFAEAHLPIVDDNKMLNVDAADAPARHPPGEDFVFVLRDQ